MKKKQLFAVLLAGSMTVGMAPAAAFAAEDTGAAAAEAQAAEENTGAADGTEFDAQTNVDGADSQQEDTEHDAADRANAAEQAGPAEHRRRHDVQLRADHRVRHRFTDAVRLEQPGDASEQAEVAVGEPLHGRQADADTARRFRIAAHGVKLSPK